MKNNENLHLKSAVGGSKKKVISQKFTKSEFELARTRIEEIEKVQYEIGQMVQKLEDNDS